MRGSFEVESGAKECKKPIQVCDSDGSVSSKSLDSVVFRNDGEVGRSIFIERIAAHLQITSVLTVVRQIQDSNSAPPKITRTTSCPPIWSLSLLNDD